MRESQRMKTSGLRTRATTERIVPCS